MTTRRAKKVRKQRGSRVYGYGRISGGHRKGGSRGGVGKAGSKGHHRIGHISDMIAAQRGFTAPNPHPVSTINVGILEESLDRWVKANKATKEGSLIKVDLEQLGYDKLLGSGTVRTPIHVIAPHITPKAQEKIETAGGKVN